MKEERQDIDNKLLAAAGLLICDIDTALKTLDRYFEIDILWAHDEQLALLKGQQQQARQLIKQLARECNATRVEARRHMLGLRQGT
jgi:ribosomal protein S2